MSSSVSLVPSVLPLVKLPRRALHLIKTSPSSGYFSKKEEEKEEEKNSLYYGPPRRLASRY